MLCELPELSRRTTARITPPLQPTPGHNFVNGPPQITFSLRKVPRHENVICGSPLTKFCPGSGWSGGVILAVVLLDNSGNSQSIKSSFVDGCRGIHCVNLSTRNFS